MTDFWLGAISLLCTGALGVLGWHVTLHSPTEKVKPFFYWSFIGLTLLAVGAGITQGYRSAQDRAETERQHDAERRRLLAALEKTREMVSGGSSFCYLRLSNFERDKALMLVFNDGETPVYDVTVRMVMMTGSKVVGEFRTHMGNVSRGVHTSLQPVSIGGWDRINAFFSARNGNWRQTLLLTRVDGVHAQAFRVWLQRDHVPEELVKQYIESKPPFPLPVAW